jgi:hypothetical protein
MRRARTCTERVGELGFGRVEEHGAVVEHGDGELVGPGPVLGEQRATSVAVVRQQRGRDRVALQPAAELHATGAVRCVDDDRLFIAGLVLACPHSQRISENGVHLLLRARPRLSEVRVHAMLVRA